MESVPAWKQYLRLVRPQSAAGTAMAPVLAAAALWPQYAWGYAHLASLFLVGVLVHLYGFALNEYMDLKVDRLAGALSQKPLVSGAIPPKNALYIALGFGIGAFVLGSILFPGIVTIPILGLSILLGGAYDVYSKRIPGSDILLGAWVFVFCLWGALTVAAWPTPLSWLVSILFMVQLIFQTGVSGGLKDVEHDAASGARTPPLVFGVRVEDGRIIIPAGFKAYALGLKAANIVLVFIPFFLWATPYNYIQLGVLVAFSVMILALSVKALASKEFVRKQKMRLLLAQELLSFLLMPLLLLSVIEIRLALLFVFGPILWFMAWVGALYGRRLPNV